jgi:PemK-like, MazF-like toxin of type II toxin-antitoxin system
VVRGDVHQIKMPGKRGHIQEGRRFAVIVQADDLLVLSTVVICPTSRSGASRPLGRSSCDPAALAEAARISDLTTSPGARASLSIQDLTLGRRGIPTRDEEPRSRLDRLLDHECQDSIGIALADYEPARIGLAPLRATVPVPDDNVAVPDRLLRLDDSDRTSPELVQGGLRSEQLRSVWVKTY